jgi:chromosome segregation ATPase
MPNIATALKAEIARVARKELKPHIEPLKKANASHRADIAFLKKRVQELERALKRAERNANAKPRSREASPEAPNTQLRFRREGMAKNRQRLGLSAADFGLLIGTTGQSIYASRRCWVSTRTSLGFCMPCMRSEATDTSCRRR